MTKTGKKFDTIEIGYIKINCNDRKHQYKDSQGYVLEHRLVAEDKIGRYLLPEEKVHHIDKNIENNNPKNLYICTPKEHSDIHKRMRNDKTFTLLSNLDTYEEISQNSM